MSAENKPGVQVIKCFGAYIDTKGDSIVPLDVSVSSQGIGCSHLLKDFICGADLLTPGNDIKVRKPCIHIRHFRNNRTTFSQQ